MATMACRRAGGLTRRGPVSSCISYVTRVRREGGSNSQSGAASGLNLQQQQQQPCMKSVQQQKQQLGVPSRWDGFGNSHMISRSSLNPGSVAFLKPIGGPQFVRGYASDDLPPHQEIGMPSLSPTMTQGNIVAWKKKEGDQVAAGDVLCEIETDKATLEMESMEDGFLAKIIAGDGTKDIQVGQPICVMVENKDDMPKFSDYQGAAGGAKPAAPPKQEEATPPPETESPSPSPPPPPRQPAPAPPKSSSPPPHASSGGRIFASPAAKKLAAEKNVPLSNIAGTGPDGHILKADIEDYLASGSAPEKQEVRPSATREAAPADEGQTETVAAHRMLQSKQTIPHYYLSLDTKVDKIQELVEQLNQSQGTTKGKKISIDDFVIKAAALATRKVPESNSSWTDDFVRQYNNVNISVEIQSEKELLVPVVKDVDRKGIATISEEIEALVEKAKSNSLKPTDCEGGTFTVSILGGTGGIKQFSAIIHPPQSCILAVGTTEKRVLPGLEKGEFVSGTFVTVTLSCDHRVVDGAIGALWLGAFKGYIEDPMTLLL